MKTKVDIIYDSLPASWNEITISDFAKLGAVEITEQDEVDNLLVGSDNTIKVISVLADVPVDELESLPMSSLSKLIGKLDFMIVPPVPDKKCAIEWKNINEITYNDYILFQQFGNDFMSNLALLIPAFAKTKISEEDALKMSVQSAHTCFFFHKKALKKSLHSMIYCLKKTLVKQAIKERFQKIHSKVK